MQEMIKFADEWMAMSKEERLTLDKKQLHYFIDDDFLKILKRRIIASEKKSYIYLVTFTIDPKLNTDMDADELEEAIETYVESQVDRQVSLGITYYAYSKEYTKAGQAHWHAVLKTTKPLAKNRFAYYGKSYGNIDISRTKSTTHLEALEYISKDVLPTILIS